MTSAGPLQFPPADPWAIAAASLPLAFSQVREDPRLDLQLVRELPRSSTVVMIASGGETAVTLGREAVGTLHLVDMNRSQLALTRLKWELTGQSPDHACEILGHTAISPEERSQMLTHWFNQLDLSPAVFGPLEIVALVGPDHAGRYERTFAALRSALQPQQLELGSLLASDDREWVKTVTAPGTEFGKALDAAFEQVMSLPNLVQLFGMEATQNPRRSFASHFAHRTRVALERFPARSNPFVWQILAGQFPHGHRYDWLAPECGGGTPCRATPIYHHGRMAEVLDTLQPRSVDLVHLSNILDWLSPRQTETTLASVGRVLKPGGRVILRQLNSTLDIPAIPSALQWDLDLGGQLESVDRSFFYPGVFVGIRP
jgi:S-adenosylmethionine-diacylglycerol 3-amino-3-carboxypropyl transferase